MQRIRKNKIKLKLMTIFIILAFSSTVFSASLPTGRLIPDGKVFLYKGSQKVGEFRTEAPLPDDTLLFVQGKCGVKLNNAYMIAMDNTVFSIKTEPYSRILTLERGTTYFALASNALSFQTPDQVININKLILNASSDSGVLKGYISTADGTTKIGVVAGGSMLLTVNDGNPIMVKSGHELLLAQADLFDIPEQEPATEAETEVATEAEPPVEPAAVSPISFKTVAIVLGLLGAVGAAFAGGGGGGGGSAPPPASPSLP
ncbi:MAG: hypothetical protein JSV38_14610 [Desulfobacterales bacterium]|nr:MAG: hypothetical protein JSV38_14610 [Desulfobacterales bacterium]